MILVKSMDSKGQGALEYLLLIAAAVLIAAVVIVVITTFIGPTKQQGNQQLTNFLDTVNGV